MQRSLMKYKNGFYVNITELPDEIDLSTYIEDR